jgi:hypothetical protein
MGFLDKGKSQEEAMDEQATSIESMIIQWAILAMPIYICGT